MLILEKKTEIKVHVGPMPPPLGGISVYFYRLMRKYPQDVYINTFKHFLSVLSGYAGFCNYENC